MEIESTNNNKIIKAFVKKKLKNGEDKVYEYDLNRYNVFEKNICKLCGGCYTYWNKSHHEKSTKHKYAELQKLVTILQSNK